jgi:hypothetical protein
MPGGAERQPASLKGREGRAVAVDGLTAILPTLLRS